jgi:hypothetical protein
MNNEHVQKYLRNGAKFGDVEGILDQLTSAQSFCKKKKKKF